ncbi:MAG: hypothetical protein JKY71_06515 [Alphaproteobacteria bacterium]|nr:hypothetical protein [Alphaproteobacteria bacterium]
MFKKYSVLALSVGALAVTGACTPGKSVNDIGGQFWQRVSVSEAVYQQGPKAQQMLNRDISRCVVELRELERLGTLKDAIPTDLEGRTLDPDELALRDYDMPEREKHLFAEHSDYTDFEGCMYERGWERVEHAPFAVTRVGRENYLRAHVDYDYTPEYEAHKYMEKMNTNENGDFGDLNE